MAVRRSLAWAFAGQMCSVGIGFAASITLAHILSPFELGLNAIAAATMGVLSVISASGAGALVVREVELTSETLNAATFVNALLSLTLAGLMILFAAGARPLLGDGRAGELLRILAIVPLASILTFRPAALMQREMQFRGIALVTGASASVAAATTVVMALSGWSYRSPAIGAAVGAGAGVLFYALAKPDQITPRFSLQGTRVVLLFGARMITVSGAGTFATYFSDTLLGRLLGIDALGMYSRASLLANAVYGNIYGTATRVCFAQLSQAFRETGQIGSTFLTAFRSITGFMWPLALGMAVLSRPIIGHLFGQRWLPAAAPLSLLMLAQMITLSFGMNWELFVLRDRLATQTRFELARTAAGLAIFAVGCLFSIGWAAVGRVVDAAIGALIYFRYMGQLAELPHRAILSVYGEGALLALAAVAPAAGLVAMQVDSATLPLPLLILAAATGVGLWLVTLRWMKHPLFIEMKRTVAHLSRSRLPKDDPA